MNYKNNNPVDGAVAHHRTGTRKVGMTLAVSTLYGGSPGHVIRNGWFVPVDS
jgi:hypothetical protein